MLNIYFGEMPEAIYDEVVKFRNYVDHFKYFVKHDRSILELFGDAFDRAASHSEKLHKSILWRLENLLARQFARGTFTIQSEDVQGFDGQVRKTARICLAKRKDEV